MDSAFATIEWVNLFPMARVHHLTSSTSDHSLLALRFVRKSFAKQRKKLYRFELRWLKDSRCEEVVLDAWTKGMASQTPFPLITCLNAYKSQLDAWNKA